MLPLKNNADPRFKLRQPLLLVSYPKSGNTWVRIFLANYLADEPSPLKLNDLRFFQHIAGAVLFEHLVGYPPWELSREQQTQLRREMHGGLKQFLPLYPCFKVHDNLFLKDGQTRMFPAHCGQVIYVVRNPLDVCVSLMHHFNLSDLDMSVNYLAGEAVSFEHLTRGRSQLPQHYGSWSAHVRGWSEVSDLDLLVLRYEDLCREPRVAFAQVLAALGLGPDPERLDRAISACSFERLQVEERDTGFVEHFSGEALFFRSGKSGGWRERLNPQQVRRIVADQGELMQRFGYLDAQGEPI